MTAILSLGSIVTVRNNVFISAVVTIERFLENNLIEKSFISNTVRSQIFGIFNVDTTFVLTVPLAHPGQRFFAEYGNSRFPFIANLNGQFRVEIIVLPGNAKIEVFEIF